MVSAENIFWIFEKFGLVNLQRFQSSIRNRFQSVYVSLNFFLLVGFASSESYNVISRTTRYFPEFVQTLVENSWLWLILYILHFLQTSRQRLIDLLEQKSRFSQADRQVIQTCHRQAKRLCQTLFVLGICALYEGLVEAVLPISQSELQIRRNVYRNQAHPERRLPNNIRIPFLDESESWAYEMIFVWQCHIIMLMLLTISPLIMIIVFCNSVFYALILYILVTSFSQISSLRYFKFLSIFLALIMEFYLVCNSSEAADDGSIMLVKAIKYSRWDKCTSQTRRDLCILLRRAQRPNHLKFNKGVIVLSRPLFLQSIKIAFSFVNCFRSFMNKN
ncbi:hypothetical protein WDU94_010187 [Cyamophila willieti]